jgi:hypothetical protein
MMQTRQAVHAVKQSIFLDVYGSKLVPLLVPGKLKMAPIIAKESYWKLFNIFLPFKII